MENRILINNKIRQPYLLPIQDEEIQMKQAEFFFMSQHEWGITLGVAVFLTVILFPLYSDISLWIALGVILTTLVSVNIVFAIHHIFPYPQLAILIACIQFILAAWGNFYYPHSIPIYNIQTRLPMYLSYAMPACIFFAFGLLLPLIKIQHQFIENNMFDFINRKQLIKELDFIFIAGVAATFLKRVTPLSLQFVTELVANLSYIGLFGYLLFNISGWKWRIIIFLFLLFSNALWGGIFHNLILWGVSLVLGIAYCHKWNIKRIFVALIFGIMGVILVHAVKLDYRERLWYSHSSETQVEIFLNVVLDNLLNYDMLFSYEKISLLFVRLNQGWIVNRSMIWTPRMEPYANGKTITDSIIGSLVPRFLNPEKEIGGYKDDYQKYTGLELLETSMSLGYAGEMYVNFGPVWGVLGVGAYGLLLGLGFRWLYRRALTYPLWWGWVAYFATPAIKAEDSIGFIINWLIKAAVIMFAVLWLCPALRSALGMNKTTSHWN